MKHLIILFAFMLIAVGLSAQNKVSNNTSVISITGVAKDSVVTGTAFEAKGNYPVHVNIALTCTP